MVWQDYVISVAVVMLAYALVPQVVYGFKKKIGTVKLQTGIITTIGLIIMASMFFTLDLYFSTVINLIISGLWLTLTIQTIKYGKKSK